jgi:hypothetical protein
MRFRTWVAQQGRGELSRIARVTGLAYSTVYAIYKGTAVPGYGTAKKLSRATQHTVTIDELCGARKRTTKSEHSASTIAGNDKAIVRQGASQA